MKNRLAHLLIGVLVVTGTFVALASSCQSALQAPIEGGVCSEARYEPFQLQTATDNANVPVVRWDLVAIVAAVFILTVPSLATSFLIRIKRHLLGNQRRMQTILRD